MAGQDQKKLSVVLPTYNEEKNIEIFIPQIEEEFQNELLEIIVVDDNSNDGTKKLLAELNDKFGNIKLISRPKLMGIGSAIRDGYNAAIGEYILSSDADLSFQVGDMRRLYEKLNEGYDLVLAYRHGNKGGYERKKLFVKIKYMFSRFGNFAVRNISGLGVRDVSANFRIIRRAGWHKIQTVENTNSLLFEMIVKAKRKGLKIAEIPITFSERRFGKSKLNILKEAPKFLVKFIKYTFFD
ncbi:glycosyltransferase [Candidatus Azambacteria bacterium]|nr:glycosyltransferase [Candidatus Azambacteria bacterium]